MPVHLILLVFALVLAVVGAFWNPPQASLGWLAFACFVASVILQ